MERDYFEKLANFVVVECDAAWQNPGELAKILELANKMEPRAEPKKFVEIGFGKGGTFLALSQVLPPNSRLVSISLPDRRIRLVRLFVGSGAMRALLLLAQKIFPSKKIKKFNNMLSLLNQRQELVFIGGDSTDSKTVRALEKALGEKAVDFLFIDGSHEKAFVEKDFEKYGPFVGRGGMIAFHDIALNPGVKAVWRSIKGRKKEFNFPSEKGVLGIGVLFK